MHAIPAAPIESSASSATDLDADLQRAWWLANWMDSQFEVGGIKFGLDAVVGLIPLVGDTLTALASLYPLYIARKHKLGQVLIARMAVNVGVDWLAGSVPLLGDLLDVGFKANTKNFRLLEEAIKKRRSTAQ